ncbi:metallophosphoesterase [Ectobacillus polymachus]|uniref:metallophosphoesterase n=1 Tax=Ectobacillus polymachus TaxID=1508806 RepID=UPI003A8C4E8D
MRVRQFVHTIGMIVLYILLTFYIGWNGWAWLHTTFSLPYWAGYPIVLAVLSCSFWLGRFVPVFRVIGSYWFAILQYAVLLLPIADGIVFFLRLLSFSKEQAVFWSGIVTILAFIIIFAYGTWNAYSPIIRTYEVHIPKQVTNRTSLRIAMASDMHFGQLSGIAHLKRLVQHVNKMKPDIILLPGDIIDDRPTYFIKRNMGQVMKQMHAPLGIYGVLGNHEYYGGEIPVFLQEMKNIGVHILLDEVVRIDDSFLLVGRKDKTDRNRQSFEEIMRSLDKSLPIIAMDHQPAELKQAQAAGVDVLLSGHTHRGQMAPNHLITQRVFELDWGFLKRDTFHAIVSSGFGFWGPPLRLGSRSEIIQIEITFR